MKLVQLKLNNFKGIKDLKVEFGDKTQIQGANGTGKTSVMDAFLWLLFDKDSNDKKDFEIKTLLKTNEPIHKLEHMVEGKFKTNDETLTLKKIYKEVWSKKRGDKTETFKTHTNEFYINEVPAKKGEYEDFIKTIVDEKVFKVISSTKYFNEVMSWQERRELLFEIAGNISDKDVIKNDKVLEKLTVLLSGNNTVDDIKKIAKNKLKKINEDIDKIPIRIDEATKSLPELNINFEELEIQKKEKNKLIQDKNKEIEELEKKKNDIDSALEEKNKLKMNLNDLKNEIENKSFKELNDIKREKNEYLNDLDWFEKELNRSVEAKKDLDRIVKSTNEELEELRKKLLEEKEKNFKEPDKDNFNCPMCKQKLPDDEIEKTLLKLKDNFDSNKTDNLKKISVVGKSKKEFLVTSNIAIENNEKNQKEFISKIENLKIKINEFDEKIKNLESNKVDGTKDQKYIELNKKIEEFNVLAFDGSEIKKIKFDIDSIKLEINEIDKKLYTKEQYNIINQRIVELEKEHKMLIDLALDQENILYLTEQFIKTKVDMIESNINKLFDLVKFKLFKEQINGGILEVCETLVDGVPYNSLNTASKVNAGIDIIKTVQGFYGQQVPVFIDNKESVTDVIELECQTIFLKVNPEFKKIKMEVLS